MPKAFVYGAQMIHPESVGAAWPARVQDHAVEFVARGVPVFEPCFAALVAAPGATAHGAIVDFDDASWATLVELERSYVVVEIEAELLEPADADELGAARLSCLAFRIQPWARLREPRRPSARYARKLAAGARAHGLPPEVVARYERAAAEGGRASLALVWLYPLASRIGLVPTAVLLVLVIVAVLAAVIVGVSQYTG